MKNGWKAASKLTPLRDLPIAFGWATCWVLILVVSDYPTSDWIGIGIISYLIFLITLVSWLLVASHITKRLRNHLRSVTEQMGIPESHGHELGTGGKIHVWVTTVGLILVPIGASIILTASAASMIGLPSLHDGVQRIGYLIIGLGFGSAGQLYAETILTLLRARRSLKKHIVVREQIYQQRAFNMVIEPKQQKRLQGQLVRHEKVRQAFEQQPAFSLLV